MKYIVFSRDGGLPLAGAKEIAAAVQGGDSAAMRAYGLTSVHPVPDDVDVVVIVGENLSCDRFGSAMRVVPGDFF